MNSQFSSMPIIPMFEFSILYCSINSMNKVYYNIMTLIRVCMSSLDVHTSLVEREKNML